MRAYKTVNDAYIEPISFTVPRRAETFQADIFPPATGNKPAVSAQEWLDGKTAVPAKIDLESVYEGDAPKEVASDYKPPPKIEPVPVAKPKEEPKKEEPKPAAAAVRSPPPTMKEQKGSIAALANKYQDNEEVEEEEDDASSFEEISKPPQRAQQQPIQKTDNKPAFPSKVQTTPTTTAPAPKAVSPVTKTPISASTPTAPSTTGLESGFDQIKLLIENQTKLISSQNDKISLLVSEVDALKKKVGSGTSAAGSQDQSERIRQLELELEEARS